MAHTKLRYTLYKRTLTNKSGKQHKTWYAKIVNADTGVLVKRASTGQSNRSAADVRAREIIDEVSERATAVASTPARTFREAASQFFDKDGHYAESRRARGYSVSNSHLDISAQTLKKHILPVWKETPVSEMTTGSIDRWILALHKKNTLAPATVNKILQVLRNVLDGAVSLGYIGDNPASHVKPIRAVHRERGVLTDDEVRDLLQWPGPFRDYRHYAINLLAFATGARMSELRGLLVEHVHPDRVDIVHGWEEGYGLKEPKYRSVRSVPISPAVYDVLARVIRTTHATSLVFYGAVSADRPMSKSHIETQLRRAIVKMKTPDDTPREKLPEVIETVTAEVRERNIGVHSWRHKLNTVLRSAGVPDSKIRLLTGHRGEAMTDWYTRYSAEDFRDVRDIQATLLDVSKNAS